MITIWPVSLKNLRVFGWVQDPSNLRSLCNVTAIFDSESSMHKELVDHLIDELVSIEDGKERLLEALKKSPLKISYSDLVGTSFRPRSESRCNGIVQATVKGQVRPFIGDWQADNFVRWAYAFHFIQYNYADDTFEITQEGKELVQARTSLDALSEKELSIITYAALSYPPAVRILNLLAEDDAHLTKFELGNKLGFIGEAGFTSLPQSVFLRALASIEDPVEANKMKSDWEGSSDKYARMIAKWLSKLGLVEMKPKNFSVETKKGIKEVVIGQAYQITAKGIKALKYTTGKSSYRRMKKNVCYEMLATKSGDREYLRSRRSYILKYLSEGKGLIKDTELLNYLQKNQIRCNLESIQDDIKGLINIGLSIKQSGDGYLFLDEINDFIIPKMEKIIVSENEDLKEELRSKLTHLSHEYLSLLDLAYDSKQNRLFEFKVLQLLTEECGFHGFHLGGSRKPDGIISSPGLYGVIIDTKAYSKGYSLPISQADEMERYIGENQSRDEKINPNRWWNNFDSDLVTYHYMFVAGHFKGKYQEQIQRVNYNKKVTGAAVSVKELLLLANDYKAKKVSHQDIEQILFQGKGA